MRRQFRAEEPNRLWVGDLSYLRCWEGIVYFAFIIDVFSRRVVGWQLASHMRTDLILDKPSLRQTGSGSIQLVLTIAR